MENTFFVVKRAHNPPVPLSSVKSLIFHGDGLTITLFDDTMHSLNCADTLETFMDWMENHDLFSEESQQCYQFIRIGPLRVDVELAKMIYNKINVYYSSC
ncbi:MAG: hypothetical protein JSS82_15835 [Bacteroidetes bacterium]|nr:hypothetical protein [Bacteroidota bacterium]